MAQAQKLITFSYLLILLLLTPACLGSSSRSSSSSRSNTASPILLPPPTGPHPIGLTHIELVDPPSRSDPHASPRALMLSVYYPTTTTTSPDPNSSSSSPPSTILLAPRLAPQFGPLTAPHIDALLSLAPGTSARLTTRAHLDARFSPPPPPPRNGSQAAAPLLLFSPGLGLARGLYSALLSALAARGWVVVALDHPGDAAAVEHPDGTVALPRAGWDAWPLGRAARDAALRARGRDLRVVGEWALGGGLGKLLGEGEGGRCVVVVAEEEEGGRRGGARLGVFGHSFGGAAAVQMLSGEGVAAAAAADLDGYLYGPVVRDGTHKPVLVLGFPEHYATDDPDAAPGWPALRGWRRDYTVAGAVHESFSDYPLLADLLGEEAVGAVGGTRMLQIMETYVDAFFRKFLLGVDDEGLLGGNCSAFPELSLRRS
ncbi:hypothetical protein F4809DRAFT_659868 [Biscogniauxia mediterranea]|nr:hypothetical protein F4809DRAFT_659868 [Biscogniauxia mediterranea]